MIDDSANLLRLRVQAAGAEAGDRRNLHEPETRQPALPRPAAPVRDAHAGRVRTAADLGALIRAARKAMAMTQAQFAAHAGVGRRFVSELEGGKASLEFDRVMACAEAAGVDLIARRRGG